MTFRRRRRLTDRDLIAARPTDRIPKGQPMRDDRCDYRFDDGRRCSLALDHDGMHWEWDTPATLKEPKPDGDPNRFVRVPEDAPTLADARPIIDAMVRSKVGRQALAEAVAWSIEEDKVRGGTLKAAATWLRMLARGEKL